MANKVSWVYTAIDKYTKVAQRIANSTKAITRVTWKGAKAFKSLGLAAGRAAKSVLKVAGGLTKAALKITGLSTAAAGATALILNKFVDVASDAEENASKFAVVFKSVENNANTVAANLAKNYGLSTDKSKELLSATGDLLSGFGFSGKSALDLSEKVQTLAVDLASFTNFSGGAEGASAALTKALLGERESIKSLGISILEEDVKKKVAILRAKGMRFETERQAKAYATLTLAQEQSKNAIGDYARTSEGLANQKRLLTQRVHDLVVTLGQKLMPIWSVLTRIAVKAVTFLNNKFGQFGQTISVNIAARLKRLEPTIRKLVESFAEWFSTIDQEKIDNFLTTVSQVSSVFMTMVGWLKDAAMLVGDLATRAGQLAGAISTGNFKDILNILGIGDGDKIEVEKRAKAIISGGKSQADVNINLRSPQGAVESVTTKTSGKSSGLNLGMNMQEAL